MFNLLKRTKIQTWETELLIKTLNSINKDYTKVLVNQVKNNLLKGVLTNISDIEGYVAFKFNASVLSKYQKINEPEYIISGIRVFDKKSNSYLNYSIYVYSGVISGYSFNTKNKVQIDLSKIDISKFDKESSVHFTGIEVVKSFFKEVEETLLDKLDLNNVLEIEINEGNFYTIKDLEDGNYIAIDKNGKVFGLIHDPYEIEMLYKNTELFIKDLSSGKFDIQKYYDTKFN